MTTLLARDPSGWRWSLLSSPDWQATPLPAWNDVPADKIWPREGWLALAYNMRAGSGVVGDFSVAPMPLTSGMHPVPHQDRQLLWLSSDGEALAVDGGGRTVGAPLRLPPGESLAGAFDDVLLTWSPQRGATTLHAKDGSRHHLPKLHVEHVSGRFAFLLQLGGGRAAKVLDLHDGSTREVDPVIPGTWDLLSCLSPDGRTVAITYQASDPGPARPADMPILEWNREQAQRSRARDRVLFVVDLVTAKAQRLAGKVGHQPARPVWTEGGRSLIVDLSLWGDQAWAVGSIERLTVERHPLLQPRPSPALDVTVSFPPPGILS